MALLSKDEFASKCFIPRKSLAVYIARTKGKTRVICRDDGLIDDQDPTNLYFLNKRIVEAEKKGTTTPTDTSTNKPVVPQKKLPDNVKKDPVDEKRALLYEQDRLSIKLKNEKMEAEILKIRLANEKAMGEFAKVSQVKPLFVTYSESLNSAYETIFDDFIRRVSLKYQLTREELTAFKAEKNNSINKAKERAVKIAKEKLKKAQQDLAEQKGVGDHQ